MNKKRIDSLYYKIMCEIKEYIIANQLKAGDMIPSEAQICEQYGVSRITAKKALNELMQEGFIRRLPGIGNVVTFHAISHIINGFYSITEDIRRHGMIPSKRLLCFEKTTVETCSYASEISGKLGLNLTDEIYIYKRLRLADGEIVALECSYLPVKLFPDLTKADLKDSTLYSVFENKYNISVEHSTESFTAQLATPEVAEDLSVRPDTAILRVARICFADGKPLEYTYRYFPGEKFVYSINLK